MKTDGIIKLLYLGVILILGNSGMVCLAQKEYNNWYFGDSAGISFDSGAAVADVDGVLDTSEGCASISDSSGALLFYTDGVKVYNSLHQQMPNGFGLLGSTTTTQSALIIQKPLCNSIYYLFTCAPQGIQEGLNYSVVDMELNSGLGDVAVKNIPMLSYVSEKLTAIRHYNGVDIWLIAHGANNNRFYSWRLTHSGLVQTPVTTDIGALYQALGGIGQMKPSPKGDKIVCAVDGLFLYQLAKFDKLTGYISDLITLDIPEHYTSGDQAYGCEFSADGKSVYVKNTKSRRIYRYDLTFYDSSSVVNSIDSVGYFGVHTLPLLNKTGTFQLGPDNKIYIARCRKPFLAIIHHPNLAGDACSFQDTAIDLNGGLSYYGLPNNPFIAPYIQYTGCYNGNYTFHLTDTTSYQHWDFGIPSLSNDTANTANPSWTFPQPGVYTISCIYLTDWNTMDTVFTTVYSSMVPDLIPIDTLFSCDQDSVMISADPAFDKYQWSNGGNSSTNWVGQSGMYYLTASDCYCPVVDSVIVSLVPPLDLQDTSFCPGDSILLIAEPGNQNYQSSNGSTDSTITVSTYGMYSVTVTSGSCTRSDSITVTPKWLNIDLGSDTNFCQGESVVLHASGGTNYLWNNGDTEHFTTITIPGTYWVSVSLGNCSGSDTVAVAEIMVYLDLGEDTILCEGETITLTARGDFDYCVWTDLNVIGLTNEIKMPGEYTAYATRKSCLARDTILVRSCGSIVFPNVFTPNQDMVNDVFEPEFSDTREYMLTVFNRWGTVIFKTSDINQAWDGKFKGNDCQEGTYYYSVSYKLRVRGGYTEHIKSGIVTLLR